MFGSQQKNISDHIKLFKLYFKYRGRPEFLKKSYFCTQPCNFLHLLSITTFIRRWNYSTITLFLLMKNNNEAI